MLSADTDAALLLHALHFASAKHGDQRRRDSRASPFVTHPIETAWLLASGGVRDTVTLVAAVLHDILEDTSTAVDELDRRFGVEVRMLVVELTDEAGLSTAERRRRQVACASRASCRARQIRLADKIANLRSLPIAWSRAESEEYVAFAEQVAATVRGTNPYLDKLFVEVARRARLTLARAGRPGLPPVQVPVAATKAYDVADDDALRLLRKWHGKAEELLDTLLMRRNEHGARRLPAAASTSEDRPGPRKPGRAPRRFADPRLAKLAEPGVGSLEFKERDAHYVSVSVDGAKWFPVPTGLARLLRVVAFSESSGDEPIPPFMSLSEVAVHLEKLTGRPHQIHAITVAIGRLRAVFHDKGHANPLLIETHPTDGVRFRLRRTEVADTVTP